MTHTEDYRDHRIAVSTLAHDDGSFGWEYRVDEGHATRSKKRPLRSELLAVADALGYAKAQIDAFIWTETRAS